MFVLLLSLINALKEYVGKVREGMRIGINALFFIPGKVGGSETYIRNLVSKFAEMDAENEYFLFTNRENRNEFKIDKPNFQNVPCPIKASFRPSRILWEQLILPIQAWKYGLDLLFSPGYTAPFLIGCKQVVTIYDLNYYYHPEDFSRQELIFWKILIPLSTKGANRIISISENSRQDVVNILGVPPERVTTVYLAASAFPDLENYGDQEISEAKKKYGISGNYILSVAAFHPHKNTHRLIEAYHKLKGQYGVKHKLVLVGMKGKASGFIESMVKKMSLDQDVVIAGWVTTKDIPALYKGADLFVFPSLFEGFGIPPLEAMMCGTPVATSHAASLPEVVGEAGMYFNPLDVDDMAAKIWEIMRNRHLRNELIRKGFAQAKKFSWEKTAIQTLKVFEEVVSEGSRV